MNELILIKYGELTTKKGNRKAFINKLSNNIKKSLENIDYKLKADRSRLYIESLNQSYLVYIFLFEKIIYKLTLYLKSTIL